MKPKYLESNSGINSIVYGHSCFSGSIYLYLHGAGEFGFGFERQYQYSGFATLLRDDEIAVKHPFVIACCQRGSYWQVDKLDAYFSDLRREFENAQIDLIGFSRGGTGVYSYISSHSNVRTATVVNSRPPSVQLRNLKVPLHIIHAERDQVSPIESVKMYLESNTSENVYFSVVQGDHYSIESVAKSAIWEHWIERST